MGKGVWCWVGCFGLKFTSLNIQQSGVTLSMQELYAIDPNSLHANLINSDVLKY